VLLGNAVFFHGKSVVLVATPADVQGTWHLPVPASSQNFVIVWRDNAPPPGPIEIRGLFFDVGRFAEDDSRLPVYNIPAIVHAIRDDAWPPRETLFVLLGATWTTPPPGSSASIRSIVLDPSRSDGKTVTVRGRFRGQNIFGDLPMWPRQSQWDFVLQTADAAIWVTGLRPRGTGFDFDPKSRRNTDRWLEVTGVVHTSKALPFVAAQRLKVVDPTAAEAPALTPPPAPPPLPPPTVVFSAPANGEIDASVTSVVRVQFSRDMQAASFDEHVKVTYGPGTPETPPRFTVTYRPGNLAIEIRFTSPLAPFAMVTVGLGVGITAKDGIPLAPAKITFTLGGRQSRPARD
jgi:hypothetical protein